MKLVGIRTLLTSKRSIQPPRDKDIFDLKQFEKLLPRDEAVEN